MTQQKVLIAVDESENATRAVDFVARDMNPQHQVTLLGIVPDVEGICKMDSPSLIPYFRQRQGEFCAIQDQKRDLVAQALENAKRKLIEAGYPEQNVTVKFQTLDKGVARDIAKEAEAGYDAVVMGRRGLSGIREFVMGSVSHKVMHAVKGKSLVLVD
jgi:nucleotide-binding universal stress UspA family protein